MKYIEKKLIIGLRAGRLPSRLEALSSISRTAKGNKSTLLKNMSFHISRNKSNRVYERE
jgi:hypothetical protein